ncbi:MAG: hypothetical protein ACK4ZD_09100 [Caldimonas sp.]|uniref:hypothetical protein n=1 Tax=Caldimonas sp. TaxID=2838790 RepID=UPI00391B1083
MILDVADIRIHPGQQAVFDEAIRRGVETLIARAGGYRGDQRLTRGWSHPSVTC